MRAKFVNEEQKQGSLFRSTDQIWLRIFLDQDQIMTPEKEEKFISLSRDSDSGGQDDFGGKEVVIEFDEQKIFNQGAEEIWYESDYFNENPTISLYATGFKNEKDYYDQKGYSGAEEANADFELTWDQYVEDYAHEEEIVMKKLKYEPEIIKHVDILSPAHPILIEMLEENNITYNAHKGIKEIKKEKFFWED